MSKIFVISNKLFRQILKKTSSKNEKILQIKDDLAKRVTFYIS